MHLRLVRRSGLIGVTAAAALLMGAVPASAAPGDGSAFVVDANVTLLGGAVIDVGPLAPSNTNGPTDASLASVNIPGLLSTGVVTSQAVRDDATGAVHAQADVANVAVALGIGTIGAVNATCDATQAGNTGSTTLANVQIAGVTVGSNPGPNTTFNIGLAPIVLGQIIFNEQIPNPDGSLTVNAVHIKLGAALGSGDIIIAQARCGPAAPPIPMASGLGLWIGLGIVGLIAVPVAITVIRKRGAAVQAA